MTGVTQILSRSEAGEAGEARATDELLPLVYDALHALTRHKLAREKPR